MVENSLRIVKGGICFIESILDEGPPTPTFGFPVFVCYGAPTSVNQLFTTLSWSQSIDLPNNKAYFSDFIEQVQLI